MTPERIQELALCVARAYDISLEDTKDIADAIRTAVSEALEAAADLAKRYEDADELIIRLRDELVGK